VKKQYTDRFGSKYRYSSKYPIGTPLGTNLYQRFVNSDSWEQLDSESRIIEKNDNRMDVFLGNDFRFRNINTGDLVDIKSSHSNTGKTITWTFETEADEFVF
tara:strand:- start:1408 stop:1713 length:306 start_codon:yes stop_codon:yes gene_type:complete